MHPIRKPDRQALVLHLVDKLTVLSRDAIGRDPWYAFRIGAV